MGEEAVKKIFYLSYISVLLSYYNIDLVLLIPLIIYCLFVFQKKKPINRYIITRYII